MPVVIAFYENEALRAEARSFPSSVGEILRSRKPLGITLGAAATSAFIPGLESPGFSAKEDNKTSVLRFVILEFGIYHY